MRYSWISLLVFAAVARGADNSGPPSVEPKMSWLDNGALRLGVDLAIGGAITYLAESNTKINMINSHDWGRQVQMSFYSGPNPFVPEGATVRPAWKNLGWNPIQSGDCFGYPSQVVAHENDGSSIYVRCIPKHWPLKNTPGECEFECWFQLKDNTVVATSKITNRRADQTQYRGRNQELPAVYTNGPWYKLVSYLGDQPFTGQDPTVIVDKHDGKGWPWRRFKTPEHWAALLDENDRGLGIHLPGACAFTGGFADGGSGKKGIGGPKDRPTGYMTPLHTEILDHNIEYAYRYTLIVGTLNEIRDHVYQNQRPQRQPTWNFKNDRQHWHYTGATDTGWPIDKALKIPLNRAQEASAVSPVVFWKAEDAPTLYLQAAFETDAREAKIALQPFEPNDLKDWPQWGANQRPTPGPAIVVPFPIQGDGTVRTTRIDLGKIKGYTGVMTRLKILLPKSDGLATVYSVGFESPESR